MSRIVFLDTETTGLNPEAGDRVIEIGCIEMVNRRLTERRWHTYLNPQRSSSPDAVRIHGLTDAFLADKPYFADVASDFLAFVDAAELVIHNAGFDLGFLDAELRRIGRPELRSRVTGVVDSLVLARSLYPGKSNSLDALCRRLEVDNSGRDLHGALLDAGLLAEVYIRMTRGQETLAMESAERRDAAATLEVAQDLSGLHLAVLPPSEAEQQAHEAILSELDAASNRKTIWRSPVQ